VNLWDLITGSSSLPVQTGTTFWDHMQNQQVEGAIGVDRTYHTPFKSSIKQSLSSSIKQSLSSNLTGNELDSTIKHYLQAKVSK
jgi:hypothetical protein